MAKVNPGFAALVARFPGKAAHLGRDNTRPGPLLATLRLCAFSAAVAGLLTFGCGTYATLHLAAPASAVTGSAFTITVSATIGTSPDKVINSPIRFTSSDPAAVLPPPYYFFTANDAGSHTFTNGVTLMTAGSQSITVTVIGAPGLTATANVTVVENSSSSLAKSRIGSVRTGIGDFESLRRIESQNLCEKISSALVDAKCALTIWKTAQFPSLGPVSTRSQPDKCSADRSILSHSYRSTISRRSDAPILRIMRCT